MKFRELTRLIEEDGWYLKRQAIVTVPGLVGWRYCWWLPFRQAEPRRATRHGRQYPLSGRLGTAQLMSEYLVIFEHANGSWGAYCPELPGVGVVGESREEVGELIREAIELHLEDLKESGQPVPAPSVVETAVVSVQPA